jgi:hypothetical protein
MAPIIKGRNIKLFKHFINILLTRQRNTGDTYNENAPLKIINQNIFTEDFDAQLMAIRKKRENLLKR